MKQLSVPLALLLMSACATPAPPDNQEARGQALAAANCAACHAIGAHGESPAPEAPPFRTLSRNYRVDTLQEALAEGISVGHPAMPHFRFEPDEVDAMIAYLQSIQDDRNS